MKTVNKTVQNVIVALTENEENVLRLLVTKGTQNGGTALDVEEGNMFLLEDVYAFALSEYGKNKASVKGTLSNLKKKGFVKMYAGDGYFDGELTDEALRYWSHITNASKVSKSQTTKVTNMENSNKDSVIDERIVRMNAILSTKLSAISKGKREGLKAQKSSCKFLLENWDNEELLLNFAGDKEIQETQYELYCIAKSRIDQLQAIKRQEEHKKAVAGVVKEVKAKKTVKATSEKKEAASKQQKQSKHNVGDLHPNGKWVWTEYKPGKFDWRGIPKDGKTVNAQPKKSTPNTNKATKTKSEKKSDDKKIWTMKDFEERCGKGAGQGLTKTQKEVKKYLLRGYKIELIEQNGHYSNNCFLKKEGEATKSSFRDSIDGLFRKMGMEAPSEIFLPRTSK